MTHQIYRQGDVLLLERGGRTLPKGARKKSRVLAYGEVTGHKHQIVGAAVYATADGQQVVQVEKPARLVHEEHGEISIPPGLYDVVIQREYDPMQQLRERKVAD